MTSEVQGEVPEDHPSATAPSPGAALRAARENAKLSQQDVADKLFLRARNIDDIENDVLDPSRPVTFMRGYVRSYAKLLGLSEEQLLGMFDDFHTTPIPAAKLQSFSKKMLHQTNDARWMMVTYSIIIVLVAAFVLWWWQQTQMSTPSQSATPNNEVPVPVNRPVEQAIESPEAFSPDAKTDEESAIEEPPIDGTLLDDAVQGQSNVEALVVEEPVDEVQSAPRVDADTAVSQENETVTVVFRFGSDCWVNIVDATGEAIAYGVKAAGRVMTISGVPPFDVTLGMPNNVSIEFDGDAVDLSRFQNGRTARFSLPMQDQ